MRYPLACSRMLQVSTPDLQNTDASHSTSLGVSAGNNLNDLAGDHGLTLAVVLERELLPEIPGIVRGRVHGVHASSQL